MKAKYEDSSEKLCIFMFIFISDPDRYVHFTNIDSKTFWFEEHFQIAFPLRKTKAASAADSVLETRNMLP